MTTKFSKKYLGHHCTIFPFLVMGQNPKGHFLHFKKCNLDFGNGKKTDWCKIFLIPQPPDHQAEKQCPMHMRGMFGGVHRQMQKESSL